jgi:hypothetical protein
MNSNKPQDSETPDTLPTSSSPAGQKSGVTLSHKTLGILVMVALLVIAIGVGSILYLATKKDEPRTSNASTPSEQSQNNSSETSKDNNKKQPLKTGIKTDKPAFELQLDSVESNANSITINLSVLCVKGKNTDSNLDCYTGDLWPPSQKVLARAYVVDDAAQQKYEVIKDANDKPVTSDTERATWIGYGQTASYFVNITKPPTGANLTLYIPGVQPITGITFKD